LFCGSRLKSNLSPTEIFHRKISPLRHTPRSPYSRERDQILILQEAVWAPVPVLTGTEHLAFTGILFPHEDDNDDDNNNTIIIIIIIIIKPEK
jgi:hypothetical protein